MEVRKELAAPCGLYCGVCAIYVADRDNNVKFKERLTGVWNVSVDELTCKGCLSGQRFGFCETCEIRACTSEKGVEGCHRCDDFPCSRIDKFPYEIARKCMLRAIPSWKELGTEKWMEAEEKYYSCPQCGCPAFRGATRCRQCKSLLNFD